MLGERHWLLDLFSNFRVHCFVLFLGLAAILVFLRRRLAATATLAGAALSAIPLLGYMGAPSQAAAAAESHVFRLVSFNVWFRNRDYARIAELLGSMRADVVILIEALGSAGRELQALLPEYPYAYFDPAMHGVVVLSRWPMQSRPQPLGGAGARAAVAQIDWRGEPLTLVGAHLHWPLGAHSARLRNAELDELATLIDPANPLIAAGDFNLTPWSPWFRRFESRSGLRDCARGQGVAPSWPAHAPWIGLRIDHCFASTHWNVLSARLGPAGGSDHRPLIVELEIARPANRAPRAE
ncbi:MAG: endonuclease/exonuclease/phosphatase family protein [Steroidobacteraceae bacterium]|jgi:endonuclease/exonuclease/phosphatase (EEP) superfamily protein YafD|nr:endonuclease/exonuclease/phosphatase family protein [Steroidobacteraceae bacterium]